LGRIYDGIKNFFQVDDWHFEELPEDSTFRLGFTGKDGRWTVVSRAREQQEQVVVYSVLPANVPPDRIPAALEFLTRANYGLVIGNFEMDLSDGEVRYKTSIDVEGNELTLPLMRSLVHANVYTVNRYYKALMGLIFGGLDVNTALTMAESGS
jgi:hypothetical protein